MPREHTRNAARPVRTPIEESPVRGTASGSPEATLTRAAQGLRRVLEPVVLPWVDLGPVVAAKRLGVEKVLTHRVIKAMRTEDPLAFLHRLPGAVPMMRVVKGSARLGVGDEARAGAGRALDEFEDLVRDLAGDRSALETVLSAWVPEARREFELRRKQAAFRAMSQLKGAQASTQLAVVLLHPSASGDRIDVVWLTGLFGLRRLRAGAAVKFATRRATQLASGRRPMTLSGQDVGDYADTILAEYSTSPLPRLRVRNLGEVVHYSLGDEWMGPKSAVDLVWCEVNRDELPRRMPRGTTRKTYVYAEVSTPAEALRFYVVAHRSLFTRVAPELRVYDTSFEGVANPNDPSRDADMLDVRESLESLGAGLDACRGADVPHLHAGVTRVCETLWGGGSEMRTYRSAIDYPIYGSQVAVLLEPDVEEV